MATATDPNRAVADPAPTRSPGLRPYRLTVAAYERIAASGAFGDKSGVFLWKGQLVEKGSDLTKGRPHVTTLNELVRLLGDLVRGKGYFVEQEQPIALDDESVPEPDLKCVRGANRDYATRTPTARDCPLVIEVADSSLADDSGEMLRAYAHAMILVYWLVNIPEKCIDVYTRPSGPVVAPGYAVHRRFGSEEDVPLILDGREIGHVRAGAVLP